MRLDDVAGQRIYHVTHLKNLPGILSSGVIFADANPAFAGRPAVDIAAESTRAVRRSTPVAGSGDATVAHFVPFFLSPNAAMWQAIRRHEPDSRLSPEARSEDAANFVILVSTIGLVADAASPWLVSDADAGHVLTRFATTRDDGDRLLRRLRADQDSESPAIVHAEVLVPEQFPLESITVVGVAHDKVRSAVKQLLSGSAYAPKVSVYPPWFAAE